MKSPCINVCQIDQISRTCTGCMRTLDEIASWTSYTDDQRQSVVDDLDRRRAQQQFRGNQ